MIDEIFSHANGFARMGYWADAAKLYDHLTVLRPGFTSYDLGLQRSLRSLSNSGSGRVPSVRLYSHHSRILEDLELRTLEVLLRRGIVGGDGMRRVQTAETRTPDWHLLSVAASLRPGRRSGSGGWAEVLSQWLLRWGSCGIDTVPYAGFSGLRLTTPAGARHDGPPVTVAMTCHNNAGTLEAAIRSVLGQTHVNLKLVVVDDASSDASREIAAELARTDSRIQLRVNHVNRGTYACRNQVWSESDAEYFCCLDADDIALPSRLAHQLDALKANPRALGVVSSWVRMTAEGWPVYQNLGAGGFVHHSVSTMMLRRDPVLRSIGYWDAVRFEADSEFMCRLQAVHGPQRLLWDDTVTVLALSRDGSLTRDPETGLDDIFGPSPIRQQYRSAWREWHASGAHLYLSANPDARPFPAPTRML